MAYKDGETFTTYCDKPYDQHQYKVVFNNGKAIIFPEYLMARDFWWQHCKSGALSHVIIVDKAHKPAGKKGF